jgi:(S)-2-hydroxyglutarate dehydrogenase
MTTWDVAVVGAGILGLACAREAQRRDPRARVIVLEREGDIALHQTGHNSGVVHAGIYYAPGSLKARLCVEGRRELEALCEDRGLPYRRCGKLIVALTEDQLPRLDELERRAHANGVAARRLDADGIREVEPHCQGRSALHVLETGVTDFSAVAGALRDDLLAGGGTLRFSTVVRRVAPTATGTRLHLAGAEAVDARRVVACAGAWSDRLAVASGARSSPRIVPFRGAYVHVRPERAHLVRTLIYPVPDPRLPFLGVHLTRGVDDEVHVGPTALPAGARDAYRLRRVVPRDLAATVAWPGTWSMLASWRATAVQELRTSISRRQLAAAAARYVPELSPADFEGTSAGVRAQAVDRSGRLLDDFALDADGCVLHVRNAPSPAATASLALAGHIVDQVGLVGSAS